MHASLFAHDAVSVGVVHVLIRGMPAVDWRDAVGTGLRAGDAAVAVVVSLGQGVHVGTRAGGCAGAARVGVAVAVAEVPGASTTISVD